ncbi:hypothetical protein OAS39_13285 [Pirellulales bacterium]|nr:hypothetical protein [Pirellulales bacterium]
MLPFFAAILGCPYVESTMLRTIMVIGAWISSAFIYVAVVPLVRR